MPTQYRAPLLLAIATLAICGCRDDMQPDDVSASTANPPASTLPRTESSATGAASDTTDTTPDASTSPGTDVASTDQSVAGDAPGADHEFARSALASGLAEVKMSRDVEARSPTGAVRTLARRIADDHEALNGKLRAYAGADADAADTDASSKAMDALILSSNGADLDRVYLQHMSDGHARSIARFEAAETTVRDDRLRTLVKEALPKLREHARAVDAQLARSK